MPDPALFQIIINILMLALGAGAWVGLLRYGIRNRWTFSLVPRRPVPWQMHQAVIVLVAVLTCVLVLINETFKLPLPPPVTLRHVQVTCLSQVLQLLLVPLIIAIWIPCQFADFGLHRERIAEDTGYGLWGLALAYLPVVAAMIPVNQWRADKPHPMFELLRQSGDDVNILLWIALSAVVLAPLFEELAFRALLQGALERELRPIWAILLSSAAFVSTHSVVDWIPLFPLALVLGYVYYRRHSLWAVVMTHGVFNGIQLTLAWLELGRTGGAI